MFAPTADKPALEHQGRLVSVPSTPLPGRPEYRLALGLPGHLKRQLLDFKPDLIHIAVPDLLGHAALSLAERHNNSRGGELSHPLRDLSEALLVSCGA